MLYFETLQPMAESQDLKRLICLNWPIVTIFGKLTSNDEDGQKRPLCRNPCSDGAMCSIYGMSLPFARRWGLVLLPKVPALKWRDGSSLISQRLVRITKGVDDFKQSQSTMRG